MREIKFRAWDKANKEMLDIEDLLWDDCTREFLIRTTKYSDYFDTEDMILMQYTGLKDKNGKEIYEGDIFKIKYNKKDFMVWVEYSEKYAQFITRCEENILNDEPLGDLNEKHIEVIGNIYDNPELIKED